MSGTQKYYIFLIKQICIYLYKNRGTIGLLLNVEIFFFQCVTKRMCSAFENVFTRTLLILEIGGSINNLFRHLFSRIFNILKITVRQL